MSSLLLWSPLLPSLRKREKYLYGSELRKFFKTAFIFYSLKKDTKLRNEIRHYILTHKRTSLTQFLRFIQEKTLTDKRELLEDISIPERVALDDKGFRKRDLFIYDLKHNKLSFFGKVYTYEGIVELPFKTSHYERVKAASHSYIEALIHAEYTLARGKGKIEDFYLELSSSVKAWDIPLRIGVWSQNPVSSRLFWFWADKEVRERVRKLYKIELRPYKLFYIPLENKTLGWSEVKYVRNV